MRLLVALLALTSVLPAQCLDAGGGERDDERQGIEIRFAAETYHELPGSFVAFTAPYPTWASQEMLVHPNTRIYLIRDYTFMAHHDEPFSAHHEGWYEGWLYLNGTDPATGMPQRLIEGGTNDRGGIGGCAGIDLFPDEIRLVIAWPRLFGPHRRDGYEKVSNRDEWRLLVSFGPRPAGERYRCNADPEGTLAL